MKSLIKRIVLITALLGTGATTPLLAKDGLPLIFMKARNIDGDSVVVGHEGEAELHSMSFGVKNSGTTHGSGGAGAGKATFSDLSLVKRQDSATGQLFLRCATGILIPDVTVTARFPDGNMEDYLIIKMTNVLVSSFHQTSAGADGVFEELSLNFSKIELSVRKRDAKGNLGNWETVSWNIATSSN